MKPKVWFDILSIILLCTLTLIVAHQTTFGDTPKLVGIKAPTGSYVGQAFVLQVTPNGNLELISLEPAMSKVFESWKRKTLEGK